MKRKLLGLLLAGSVLLQARPTTPVDEFNLSVSIYRNPTVAEQATYNTVMDWFAEGVFQATNGGAKIGNVTFIQNGNTATNTSIMWSERRAPMAYINGYQANGYILFADELVIDDMNNNIPDDDVTLNLFNPSATPAELEIIAKKAGYILAHEFMHYTYGLCDQYQSDNSIPETGTPWAPDDDDIESSFTLMSDFMRGITDVGVVSEEWINLDVYEDEANGHKDNDLNAHGRVYKKNIGTAQVPVFDGASAWDVLTKDNTLEPAEWGERGPIGGNYWQSLSGYEPLELETIGSTTYRANTDLVNTDRPTKTWLSNQVAIEIVIDASGSMNDGATPTAIEKAKLAALDLIGEFTLGEVWAGIVKFEDGAEEVSPLAEVTSAGNIQTLNTAVGTISATNGSTARNAGADMAYQKLITETYHSTTPSKAVFLLADGDNNVPGRTLDDIITDYNSQGIKTFTFGYNTGGDYNEADLVSFAQRTGGKSFLGLTTTIQVAAAYSEALDIMRGKELIISSEPLLGVGADFEVDPFWAEIEVRFGNTCGSYTPVFSVAAIPKTPTTIVGDVYKFTLAAMSGTEIWHVEVTGCPGITYDVLKNQSTGSDMTRSDLVVNDVVHQYPMGAFISASAYANAPITGLNVVAEITSPISNTVTEVVLNDNGIDGDKVAADGIYSIVWDGYTESGAHGITVTYDNDARTARSSYSKMAYAHGTNSVSEAFNRPYDRVVKGNIMINNVRADEHGNDIYSPTQVNGDNSVRTGRLDNDNDIDVFVLRGYSVTENLMVRLSNLGEEFNPDMKILDETGATIIAEFDKHSNCTENGYILIDIDPAVLASNAELFVVVSHGVSSDGIQSYAVSSGPRKSTDSQTQACPIRGGAIEGTFYLVNENSNKCVDVQGAGTENNVNVQQWNCNRTNAQKWVISHEGNGVHTITNVNSGKLLDVAWAGAGSNVQQWQDNGGASHRWTIEKVGEDIFSIKPTSDASECLDVTSASTEKGANIQSYPCNMTGAQKFRLVEETEMALSGVFKIRNRNSGKCIEVQNAAQYDGANVQQWDCWNTGAQDWEFSQIGSGVYEIRNIHSGKFLDVAYGGASSNVQVWWQYPTGASQQWFVEDDGSGRYTLKPLFDWEKCLDVAWASTQAGANMQVYSCNGGGAQQFELVR